MGSSVNKDKIRILESLFAGNYSALCFFAYSFLKDKEAAEDIAQESFECLWTNFENITDNSSSRLSYLYTVARNKCLNLLRHKKVKDHAHNENLADGDSTWEEDHMENLIRSEVYNEIFNAVQRLPARCRKIYEMTYFQEMSEKEIADSLNISVHSVKSQKQRGKRLLKTYLKHLFAVLVSI
jgi:RNA polymerase sigma-70 factor (ECF subfamily)